MYCGPQTFHHQVQVWGGGGPKWNIAPIVDGSFSPCQSWEQTKGQFCSCCAAFSSSGESCRVSVFFRFAHKTNNNKGSLQITEPRVQQIVRSSKCHTPEIRDFLILKDQRPSPPHLKGSKQRIYTWTGFCEGWMLSLDDLGFMPYASVLLGFVRPWTQVYAV